MTLVLISSSLTTIPILLLSRSTRRKVMRPSEELKPNIKLSRLRTSQFPSHLMTSKILFLTTMTTQALTWKNKSKSYPRFSRSSQPITQPWKRHHLSFQRLMSCVLLLMSVPILPILMLDQPSTRRVVWSLKRASIPAWLSLTVIDVLPMIARCTEINLLSTSSLVQTWVVRVHISDRLLLPFLWHISVALSHAQVLKFL